MKAELHLSVCVELHLLNVFLNRLFCPSLWETPDLVKRNSNKLVLVQTNATFRFFFPALHASPSLLSSLFTGYIMRRDV